MHPRFPWTTRGGREPRRALAEPPVPRPPVPRLQEGSLVRSLTCRSLAGRSRTRPLASAPGGALAGATARSPDRRSRGRRPHRRWRRRGLRPPPVPARPPSLLQLLQHAVMALLHSAPPIHRRRGRGEAARTGAGQRAGEAVGRTRRTTMPVDIIALGVVLLRVVL